MKKLDIDRDGTITEDEILKVISEGNKPSHASHQQTADGVLKKIA